MRRTPKQFIIEGIDRLGKGTLTENLLQELGYHLAIHYEKPKKLKAYGYSTPKGQLQDYQVALYHNMFALVDAGHKIIFDRAHLSEVVYAPMYRGYSGDYVFDLERQIATHDARLILLTTSDFSFIKDDGLSHDFSRKEEEQCRFIDAFTRSSIEDKVLIDVADGKGGYRPARDILEAVLRK